MKVRGCAGLALCKIIKLSVVCVSIFTLADQAGAAGVTAPPNLVAWWPADNHSYDVVATNPAVLQAGATYAPGAGEAFSLPGGTAKVYINEWPNTDLSGMAEWTIEAWVKPNLANSGTYPIIYSEGNRVATLGVTPSGYLDSWVNAGNQLTSTSPLDVNNWNHVALVFNGSERLFFINGNPVGGGASPAPNWTPYAGSAIGNSISANPLYAFAGEVDELSLYDRALEQTEIASIHAADSSGKYFDDPAPVFIVEPESRTNYLGETVSFDAVVMGVPRPTYQWFKDGTPLTGETNLNLVLTDLDFADDGNYQLVADNSSDSAPSAVATLTVRFCAETPSGGVAWWPGDGSGLDVTGNHHGAVWGNVTYPDGVVQNGPAFGFNGSDTYVAVPDDPELSPHVGTNGEMTVEAWVKLPTVPSGSVYVLAKGDSGRWEYGLSIINGVPGWRVWNPDGTFYGRVDAGLIVAGNWHHLVATVKKGEYVQLYQDGVLQGESTTLTGDTADDNTPLYIGRRSDGYFFPGSVDEVALYDRALDIGEISKLYNGGEFGKCFGTTNPAPMFVVQPAQQSGYLLLNAGLSAIASGTPRPDYQWYRDIDSEWVKLAGQTNATLAFSELDEEDEGDYMVSASNMHDVAFSDAAFLEVIPHDILTGGDDFEKGWNGWTSTGYSLWQIGQPTYGPSAHSGANCAGTVLDGNYPYGPDKWLISPPFDLPSIESGEEIVLNFWQWFSYWYDQSTAVDHGELKLQQYNTNTMSWVSVKTQSYYRYSKRWAYEEVNLSAYAGTRMRLAFYHIDQTEDTDPYGGIHHYESSGWFLDDVVITKRPELVFDGSESFEGGWNGWNAGGGVWQVGTPTSGPNGGHNGSKCVGTVLTGNYPWETDSILKSPVIDLEVLNPGEEVVLNFWQWFSYWYDYNTAIDHGELRIQQYSTDTMQWSSWTTLRSYYRYSQGWAFEEMNLSAYAGKRIRLGFYHYERTEDTDPYGGIHHYESTGWFIDNVMITKRTELVFDGSENFEDGWGGWNAGGGVWQVGVASSGPSGSTCAGTTLNGNYPHETDSRLISPNIDLPEVLAGEQITFRWYQWFYYWYDYNTASDRGYVQIQVFNTNTMQWSSWVSLSTSLRRSAGWVPRELDLSGYAGERVRLCFYHTDSTEDTDPYGGTHHYENSGWYIDNITLDKHPIATLSDVVTFESGWDSWHSDGGWNVGTPSSGPNVANSGSKCAATVLWGNYRFETDSNLMSPAKYLPSLSSGETLELRFNQWTSYQSSDSGTIRMQTNNPATRKWSNWITLKTVAKSVSSWSIESVSLTDYAGQMVRFGFYHVDATEDTDPYGGIHHYEAPGWYIDDLFVKRGNISIVSIPNKSINEVNSFGLPSTLTFDVNVVGTDPNPGLGFQLIDPPGGARINPITGQFTWTPAEWQGPGVYRIPIYVVDYVNNEANDLAVVQVTVNEVNEKPWLMPASGSAFVGYTNYIGLCSGDPDLPENTLTYSLLGTVPNGVTINSGSGMISWAPTADQAGGYNLTVRVGDGGSPNYWATNTVSIGVTTSAPTYLGIERVTEGVFEFTIHNGRDDYDYMLQQALELHGCPLMMTWEDVMLVSPSNMPPQFIYSPVEFPAEPKMFFRTRELPRE